MKITEDPEQTGLTEGASETLTGRSMQFVTVMKSVLVSVSLPKALEAIRVTEYKPTAVN